MATIDIGKIKPVFKGTYDNSTAYVLDDIVYYNGSSYVAKTSTTGNLPTDTTKWNILASGSGGIWDSTLALGSSGQAVKVNAGGTALEFGSAGSSELLGSGENYNVTSQVINNSVLTSAYEVFDIYVFIHRPSGSSGGNGYREMFVSTTNGSATDPVDRLYHFAQLQPSAGTGHSVSSASVNADRIHLNVNATTNDWHNSKIQIFRPSFGTAGERNRNTIYAEAVTYQNPGSSINVENVTCFACIHDGNANKNNNIDYVRFEMNGATFDIKYAVYGRKW